MAAHSQLHGWSCRASPQEWSGESRSPRVSPATRTDGCQMEPGHAVDLVRHTLIIALTISAPMLIIGLVVGILVSLLQAVTQIQEQTLSFIPKIVAMVAAAILLMPWTAQRPMKHSREMFINGL